jgi:succinate dehydrogenase/fumarate reductase flavoprotein subunit
MVEAIGRVASEPVAGEVVRPDEIIEAVREEMLPLEKNYWRTGEGMRRSLVRFESLWRDAIPRVGPIAPPGEDPKSLARSRLRAREAAALLAAGRWIYASASERTESRGLHRRKDFPDLDPSQDGQHVLTGGLDVVWVRRRAHEETSRSFQGAVA